MILGDNMENTENTTQGLIIVHTGDGKGKTTAALGLALRALGNDMRVLILQFIKGGQTYGELRAIENFFGGQNKIAIKQCGLGFTKRGDKEKSEHQKAAQETIAKAKTAILSGEWDMIILDEINYAVKFGLIDEKEILSLIKTKRRQAPKVHLVLTGRDALPSVIENADLATEMKLIKHPFNTGIKAQRGIEY